MRRLVTFLAVMWSLGPVLAQAMAMQPVAAQTFCSSGGVAQCGGAYSDAQAYAQAQAAIAASACTSAPAADTYGGTVGSQPPCIPAADAAAPTLVQPSSASTTSGGTFSGTWPVPFARAPTTVIAQANTTTNPFICQAVGTVTGYIGSCWQVVSTTLPNTVTAVLGLVISPVQNPAAGLVVSVVGRQ